MIPTLVQLAPEITVLLTGLAVLLLDIFLKNSHKPVHHVALAGTVLALAVTGIMWHHNLAGFDQLHLYLRNVLVVDDMAIFLKMLILTLTLLMLCLSYRSFGAESRHPGEYYTLLLFATLGEMLAVSSQELVTFFLCFELLSLPLYMLAGFRRYDGRSAEAGVKYFLTGALSSAIMLYGMSLIYGTLGTTVFPKMGAQFSQMQEAPHGLLVGLVMMIVALGFKVSAAPFHNWAPDVYEGAPTVVVAYLSTAPKAAMIGVMIRFFWDTFDLRGHIFSFTTDWVMLFSILSLMSMMVGNLAALPQTNLKRMLAYSGVAQMGFVFLGLAASSASHGAGSMGAAASLYYIAVYALANLGAWAVVALACGEEATLSRLGGLAQRSPLLAFTFCICLMSLAGVPPLAGFVGKFALFRAIYESRLPFLVVFGILNSVISLYYYFQALRYAYLGEAPEGAPPIVLSGMQRFVLYSCVLASMLLGLWPGLVQWSEEAAYQLLQQQGRI